MGVVEFKTPASELLIDICAMANKTAGNSEPDRPTTISPFRSDTAILLNLNTA